jgi:hypothetical protein
MDITCTVCAPVLARVVFFRVKMTWFSSAMRYDQQVSCRTRRVPRRCELMLSRSCAVEINAAVSYEVTQRSRMRPARRVCGREPDARDIAAASFIGRRCCDDVDDRDGLRARAPPCSWQRCVVGTGRLEQFSAGRPGDALATRNDGIRWNSVALDDLRHAESECQGNG